MRKLLIVGVIWLGMAGTAKAERLPDAAAKQVVTAVVLLALGLGDSNDVTVRTPQENCPKTPAGFRCRPVFRYGIGDVQYRCATFLFVWKRGFRYLDESPCADAVPIPERKAS